MSSLFIAHGAPLLAIENNEYTAFLSDLGREMPKPSAIVLFSAHWESRTQKIGIVEQFDTIYDFGGFPDELYQITYPAKGAPEAAEQIASLFDKEGIAYEADRRRGLDHGAWIVLRMLYPNADIPVVSMSVNPRLVPEEQYRIGKTLASLKEDGVLMIGSGGTVHNLMALSWEASDPDDWAIQFDDWLADHIGHWDLESLFDFEARAPHAQMAVPPHGNEHFVPLFIAMGAGDSTKSARQLHQSYQYGSLSQSVWQFG